MQAKDAMRRTGYGIIGLGQVSSKAHIPDLLSLPQARIVAVADARAEAVAAAQATIGDVRGYSDYRDLLRDPEVEAALIATPNWLHCEHAVAAFEAGKHVFCEKPLGITIRECDAILAAQKASGKRLQVGHELRYANHLQKVQDLIRGGVIGNVQMMLITEFRFPLLPGWRQTGKTGGVMLEKNSHFFDLFNWFAGAEPAQVIGTGGNNVNTDSPLIDHCVVTVEYANRVRATLVMCLFADVGNALTVDVIGDRGRVTAYDGERRVVFRCRADGTTQEWRFPAGADGAWHAGGRAQHAAFLDAIRDGAPVLNSGEEARKVLRVALAAERAVAGERVADVRD